MLGVRLLGAFDIKYKNKPITISSRPAQSLFAHLILHAGTAHRREKLAGLFWPDSLEETARDNLRHALWRMRKALESASAIRYLHADDLTISFKESSDFSLAAAATQKKAIAENPSEVDAATAWCADGGTIVMASDEQVAAFEAAAKPVFEQIEQDPLTAELIAAIRELKENTEPSPGAQACGT